MKLLKTLFVMWSWLMFVLVALVTVVFTVPYLMIVFVLISLQLSNPIVGVKEFYEDSLLKDMLDGFPGYGLFEAIEYIWK